MDLVVGVGDMKISDNPEVALVTYSLGSCIGLAIYDPDAKVGGLLHYMLPESSLDQSKAQKNPFMFGDTGIPCLFKAAYELGAKKNRIRVFVAGGAQILDQDGLFNIGKRNYMILRKLFWKNNIMVHFEEVGGNVSRTMRVELKNGDIWLRVSGEGTIKVWGI